VLLIHAHGSACPLLRRRRLRHRRVHELGVLAEAEKLLAGGGEYPIVTTAHGGAVAHAYGWPAETEVAVVVLLEPEVAILFGGRVRANAVTAAGAAVAATRIGLVRGLYDGRYKKREGHDRALAALVDESERVLLRYRLVGA